MQNFYENALSKVQNVFYIMKETQATNRTFPEGADFEVMSTGTTRSADYEIVYVYGKKYIIFSSGSDIEVLEY